MRVDEPEIGDACQKDKDCGGLEGKVCDPDPTDGYCTVRGCDRGECPAEAIIFDDKD